MKGILLKTPKEYPVYRDNLEPPQSNNPIVEVKAAALNHRDLWIAKGMYPGIKPNIVLGSDGSGIFDDREVIINPSMNWGTNENFQSPDFEILGMPSHGTCAQKVAVNKEYIYPKPEHLTMYEAAALPLAGLTAYRAFVIKSNPQKGDKVFISGIGGGVSLMVLKYAIAMGFEVYVSSSSQAKIIKAMQLGASGGVNYNDSDFSKQLLKLSGGIDIVIDSAGGDGFASLVYACNPGARMVFYGGTTGNINKLNPQAIFWKQIHIMGTTMGSDHDFKMMLELVVKHKIRPIIDSIYDLKDVNKAFNRMKDSAQFGKIVFDLSN